MSILKDFDKIYHKGNKGEYTRREKRRLTVYKKLIELREIVVEAKTIFVDAGFKEEAKKAEFDLASIKDIYLRDTKPPKDTLADSVSNGLLTYDYIPGTYKYKNHSFSYVKRLNSVDIDYLNGLYSYYIDIGRIIYNIGC